MKNDELYIQRAIRITSTDVFINGTPFAINKEENSTWLTCIYRTLGVQYPKFFKMDNLCKAGFLATELIFKGTDIRPEEEKRDWSILLFNKSSSLDNDQLYQETINDPNNYFPSPSVFVYTLSNIVTGEMAIRNKIMGETCSYITEKFDADVLLENASIGLSQEKGIHHLLIGWVEYLNDHCDVLLFLVDRKSDGALTSWNKTNIEKYFFIPLQPHDEL